MFSSNQEEKSNLYLRDGLYSVCNVNKYTTSIMEYVLSEKFIMRQVKAELMYGEDPFKPSQFITLIVSIGKKGS